MKLPAGISLFCVMLVLLWLSPAPQPAVAGCDRIQTFADGLTPQRELHVSVTGDDDTGDGSLTFPFATICAAAREATPGTAIVVHAGVYAGGCFVYDLYGTADEPIWIGGAAGECMPVIDGGSEGLHVVKAGYLILHDMEIRNSAYNGINCDDGGDMANPDAARYLIFENLNIHDIGGSGNQDGLKISGVYDFFVLNCDFAHCGGGYSGSGIDHVGCHRGTIANCTFESMSGNAIQCKGGTEDILIRSCRFKNAGQRSINLGGSTGFDYFRPPLSTTEPNAEARNLKVVANLFIGSTAPVAFVGCVDSVVANNTIVNPDHWILRILQETVSSGAYEFLACGGNRFENNLVYFNRGEISTYVNIGPNTAPETFAFANNLWFAHDNPAASEPTLPVPETGGLYGLDPQFTDTSVEDFSIDQYSPAAAAGLSPALVDGDIDGFCFRQPPSIGAFAFAGGCPGDLNPDGDVDGADLAILAEGPHRVELGIFAEDFGKAFCERQFIQKLPNELLSKLNLINF